MIHTTGGFDALKRKSRAVRRGQSRDEERFREGGLCKGHTACPQQPLPMVSTDKALSKPTAHHTCRCP